MSTETNQVTVETLAAFSDAFNRHDAEGVLSYMTQDCVFDAAGGPDVFGTRFVGHEAAGQAFKGVFETFADARWENGVHYILGDRGVSEWIFTGTKADGSRIEAEGVDLFTFRDGKIASKRAFRKDRPLLTAE
ncbi:MAG: nuclear transport factor 2 family protein [Sneathiella sp.]